MVGQALSHVSKLTFAVVTTSLMLSGVIACGGAQETTTPGAPAAPPPAAASPTAAPAPAASPAATQPPAASGPSGTLTVVVNDVGTPAFLNGRASYPNNRFHWAFGITETLGTLEPGTSREIGMIASSWEMAPDLSKLTVEINQGVQFHGDWGEVTAEDVAFSYNDAGADNLESVHDDAGEYSDMWQRWEAIDTYRVEGPVDNYRFDILYFSLFQGGSAPSIFSKRLYDQEGPERALTTLIATGPFQATTWRADERIDAVAVNNHWRQTPGFQNLVVLEIPENSTRVAMMETGEADIGLVPLNEIARLEGMGRERVDPGAFWIVTVWFAGNYWQTQTPDGRTEDTHGPLFPRKGFKPDAQHPWIGDPRDPARMESARKVRWAMSMAIDRDTIIQQVLDGLAPPAYVPTLSGTDPMMKPEWEISFDTQMARQYLSDAGYPNGFRFNFFIPPDSGVPSEIFEAIAAMWGNIGLQSQIERTSYSVRRPTEVNREIDIPWGFASGPDAPRIEVVNQPAWLFSQPGWTPGWESNELHQWFIDIGRETDTTRRRQLQEQRLEYMWHWQGGAGILAIPRLLMVNPGRVTGWTPHFEAFWAAAINNLETARPAQ